MKQRYLYVILVLTVALSMFRSGFGSVDSRQMLFNGKDLTGWKLFVEDPYVDVTNVWSVKNGVIRCEGKPFGYIRTKKAHSNYKLHLEWRWAEKPTNSGVLVHASEPDKLWIRSIEAQLMADNAGDIILINGVALTVDGARYQDDDGQPYIKKKHENIEKEPGQWNSYDIICCGDSIALYVNGKLQNKGAQAAPHSGYICLQSEGSPIEFRNIYIEPCK